MPGPETGPAPVEEPTETTKELSLEQQVDIYAAIWKEKGVTKETILQRAQELQSEMSEEDRRDLTMLVYIPEGIKIKDAWGKVEDLDLAFRYSHLRIRTQDEVTTKAIIAFTRYSQEPDEDSLGEHARSPREWEKTDQKFVTPRLHMIANVYYNKAHNKQLDIENTTVFPHSRIDTDCVPGLDFDSDVQFYLGSYHLDSRQPYQGVRRMASKEF